ncbi:hypothetical protein [Marinilactibacillus psychrotolerans]|uniref:hypothetical protein n=1 Tax=Marinilactibacillus psychrotolerans TaxID=191770 RepID=UPI0038845903
MINNFNIDRYITLDPKDKDDILNDICDLIAYNELVNIRELRRFIKIHGLPSMKVVNSVFRSHTGLVQLYFDDVCQEKNMVKILLTQRLERLSNDH